MHLDPRTPILVGVGAVRQRVDDPLLALEPIALMLAAAERAVTDSGGTDLPRRIDSIRIPRGFWDYRDPGRWLASQLGAGGAKTYLAEIGVLQTTLLGEAVRAIACGQESVVLVCGGEAKYRSSMAQRMGLEAPLLKQEDVEPDYVLRPAQEIWSQREADLGLLMPVNQYSVMENALRYAEGLSLSEHRRQIADMWAGFSRVAAANPDAWSRDALDADAIATADARNRMLAYPYNRLHNSQWNVDQASALLFCSVGVARELKIPESKWVFPLSVCESNHMLPLSRRARMHRSPGFRIAANRALSGAGLTIDEVSHLELYSCFPIAVRIQQRELAVPAGRALTVTGGMAFAGGPLNNFVLQALVRMAEVLRADGAGVGMVTAVSGMLTKQGVSLWSTRPPRTPCLVEDVSLPVAEETETVEVVEDYRGSAAVESYTVVCQGGVPNRAVLFCDIGDKRRVLAAVSDAATAASLTQREGCGRRVRIDTGEPVFVDG